MEVVGSQPEAELVCSILRDAGIRGMNRITNIGAGAMDGMAVGGPREIVVRHDELDRAREVVRAQRRLSPWPGSSGRSNSRSRALLWLPRPGRSLPCSRARSGFGEEARSVTPGGTPARLSPGCTSTRIGLPDAGSVKTSPVG